MFSSSSIQLKELLEKLKEGSIIPAIQRNFCWDEEDTIRLFDSLYAAYKTKKAIKTLGMFSVYSNPKTGLIEIIDGQQRLTVLRLILTCFGEKNLIDFKLDRDRYLSNEYSENCIKFLDVDKISEGRNMNIGYEELYFSLALRYNFMRIIQDETHSSQEYTLDAITISKSAMILYKKCEILEKENGREDILAFIDYLINHVQILINVVKEKPMDEFMNLNMNKIRFTPYDSIRTYMLLDKTTRKENIKLFERLSKIAFSGEYDDVIYTLTRKEYMGLNKNKFLFDTRSIGKSSKYSSVEESLNVSKERVRLLNLEHLIYDIKDDETELINIIYSFLNDVKDTSILDWIGNTYSEKDFITTVKDLYKSLIKSLGNKEVLIFTEHICGTSLVAGKNCSIDRYIYENLDIKVSDAEREVLELNLLNFGLEE